MTSVSLQNAASQRSQALQVLEQTVGKEEDLDELSIKISAKLYEEQRWRWRPIEGLQVAIPQDHKINYIARASPRRLKRRICSPRRTDGDNHAPEDFIWLLAQCLHYHLGYPLTEVDATSKIAEALLGGKMKQPQPLALLSQKLEGEYRAQQRLEALRPQTVLNATESEEESTDSGELEDTASSDIEEMRWPSGMNANFALMVPASWRPKRNERAITPLSEYSSIAAAQSSQEDWHYSYDETIDSDYIYRSCSSTDCPDSEVASVPDTKVTRLARATNLSRGVGNLAQGRCSTYREPWLGPSKQKSTKNQTPAASVRSTMTESTGKTLYAVPLAEERATNVVSSGTSYHQAKPRKKHRSATPHCTRPPTISPSYGGTTQIAGKSATSPAFDPGPDDGAPRKTVMEQRHPVRRPLIEPTATNAESQQANDTAISSPGNPGPPVAEITATQFKRTKRDPRTAISHPQFVIISDSEDEKRQRVALTTKNHAPGKLKKRKRSNSRASEQVRIPVRGKTYSLPPCDSDDVSSRCSKRLRPNVRSQSKINMHFPQVKASTGNTGVRSTKSQEAVTKSQVSQSVPSIKHNTTTIASSNNTTDASVTTSDSNKVSSANKPAEKGRTMTVRTSTATAPVKPADSLSKAKTVPRTRYPRARRASVRPDALGALNAWAHNSIPAFREANRIAMENLKALTSQALEIRTEPKKANLPITRRDPRHESSAQGGVSATENGQPKEQGKANERTAKRRSESNSSADQLGANQGRQAADKNLNKPPKVKYIRNYWEGNRPRWPRLDYILDRSESGVPAPRAPFQQTRPIVPGFLNQIGEPIVDPPPTNNGNRRAGQNKKINDANYGKQYNGKGKKTGKKRRGNRRKSTTPQQARYGRGGRVGSLSPRP